MVPTSLLFPSSFLTAPSLAKKVVILQTNLQSACKGLHQLCGERGSLRREPPLGSPALLLGFPRPPQSPPRHLRVLRAAPRDPMPPPGDTMPLRGPLRHLQVPRVTLGDPTPPLGTPRRHQGPYAAPGDPTPPCGPPRRLRVHRAAPGDPAPLPGTPRHPLGTPRRLRVPRAAPRSITLPPGGSPWRLGVPHAAPRTSRALLWNGACPHISRFSRGAWPRGSRCYAAIAGCLLCCLLRA